MISSDGYPRITLAFTDPDLPAVVPYGYAKYSDFKEMARGGRAVLWSCWDSIMGRPVALKALLPQFAQDEKERRRFLREARVTAQLQHPHTVPVYEIGRDDKGCLYFTMKMIRGEDTFKILRRLAAGDRETRRDYTLDHLLVIVIQAGQALGYSHAHGVIHRDVKPENIWVGRFGEVILLDWGVAKVVGEQMPEEEEESPDDSVAHVLARSEKQALDEALTQTGQRPGTPLYMSPEQVLAPGSVDARSDVFNLGVVLYEMIAFKEPFRGRTVAETFERIATADPVPPSVQAPEEDIPEELEAIVLKALQKKPADRHQSMEELIDAVREVRRGLYRSTD